MLAIECNPRLHSNITLMDTRRGEAAEAIYRAMESEDVNNNEDEQTIAVPDSTQKHVIWTYNELAKLLHGEGETCQFVNKEYPKSFRFHHFFILKPIHLYGFSSPYTRQVFL